MIPHTYPSSINSTTGRRQMVVYFLADITGLQRWKDYIPVKYISSEIELEGLYNNNGYVAIDELASTSGKQSWKDYIPVYEDTAATTPWQVNSTGFIQIGISGAGVVTFTNQYLNITDSEIIPNNQFFVENSVDGGNNIGWTFL